MFYKEMKLLSEKSLLIYFGDGISEDNHIKIQAARKLLEHSAIEAIEEIISGYTNLCIYFDPIKVKRTTEEMEEITISEKFISMLENVFHDIEIVTSNQGRIVEIPVKYGGEYGPDLEIVAKENGLTEQEVINIHTEGEYLVYMLGFAPGFPFLGGLDHRIATPRKQTPRLKIEAGSVGIAGEQTGVYPLSTPGGWQIIGRTMTDLFLPHETPPTLLRAGDRVKFVAVKEEEQ